MPDPRHALGIAAEDAVTAWLVRCGWRMIARRRRWPGGGEIDIVALDPCGVLVAVEVRARRTRRTGHAAATIDERRVARLGGTLGAMAATLGIPHTGLRIDLVIAEPLAGPSERAWRLARIPGLG